MNTPNTSLPEPIAFIGGGNMASAILGGLCRRGLRPDALLVVEPHAAAREQLEARFGVRTLAQAGPELARASLMVWAIKPQVFAQAAAAAAPWAATALHLSVAAGIRTESIGRWLGSERIVRAMPNTPALIGQGISGLYARAAVTADERRLVESVLEATGACLWVDEEAQLDAVTALSGSGPAYVFYFLEAMREAGTQMGLSAEQAYRLAIATFSGAAALAQASEESPETLRERVTSKGGTTHAALTALEQAGVKTAFIRALLAAHERARELGDAFGG